MNAIPISVQLYSLREDIKRLGFPAILEKVADMGYAGVELAGLHGLSASDLKQIIDRLGLRVSSAHGGYPDQTNVAEIAATAKTLGYACHIVPGMAHDHFASLERAATSGAQFEEAARLLAGHGLRLGYHNHDFELAHPCNGKYPLESFFEAAPSSFAQVDTYWVRVGGADLPAFLRRLGKQAPLLHIKDGPAVRGQPMTAVGRGVMDWPAIMGAVHPTTEWLVVELDECATDMIEAVAESYRFLTSKGWARGRS